MSFLGCCATPSTYFCLFYSVVAAAVVLLPLLLLYVLHRSKVFFRQPAFFFPSMTRGYCRRRAHSSTPTGPPRVLRSGLAYASAHTHARKQRASVPASKAHTHKAHAQGARARHTYKAHAQAHAQPSARTRKQASKRRTQTHFKRALSQQAKKSNRTHPPNQAHIHNARASNKSSNPTGQQNKKRDLMP